MNIGAFLQHATQQLTDCDIITARLDVLILLEDILGKDRSSILAHTEDQLTKTQVEQLEASITRRCTHQPLAYIRGKAAFYGRTFIVNDQVLVPRPETETMIDFFKQLPHTPDWRIADIGTGSGAIGLTAALEVPDIKTAVDLYDISPTALEVAQKNAQALGVHAEYKISNLLANLDDAYTVLLVNLPYVPNSYPINEAAQHEPRLALFAGDDGLRDYATFWHQIETLPNKPLFVLCESFPDQHVALAQMAQVAGYSVQESSDFIQLFNVIG